MIQSRSPILPTGWPHEVKLAILNVISMAQTSLVHHWGWGVHHPKREIRLQSELDQLQSQLALLREECRIKDLRMAAIPAPQRPRYHPTERLAILELRAACGWSLAETARRFLVEPDTIAKWFRRLDEPGDKPLVQNPTPINKYPDFVRYVVQRLKTLCPIMGKKRIAHTLSRAGIKLAASTVARILKEMPIPPPHAPTVKKDAAEDNNNTSPAARVVTARYPHHLWHIDLTLFPTLMGFWLPWFPFTQLQCWPYAWHIALVIDHFSRQIVGMRIFKNQPSSIQIQEFLDQLIQRIGQTPRHLVSDKGPQFWCDEFEAWCKSKKIRPRFGAIGQHGSIAVVERAIRSLKHEHLRRILIPLRPEEMERSLALYAQWHNRHRPHQHHGGYTPHEIATAPIPAIRHEPRPDWPLDPESRRITELTLQVAPFAGQFHLPVIELKAA
ncbi:MAG: DDE-type integrase/transposase/recombinase [Verrucomicrobiae bacterium]|nr:DDE-type integrase/transposase/recombinase [Verrucomicrobiae bacterium]